MRNDTSFNAIFKMLDEFKFNSTNMAEKNELQRLINNSLFSPSRSTFPKVDIYTEYTKDSEGKITEKIDKLHYKIFVAGYKKEDISVTTQNNKIVVEGKVGDDNNHFPNKEEIQRLTYNVSAKKFKLLIPYENSEIESASMEDGVLTVTVKSVIDKNTQKIDIK